MRLNRNLVLQRMTHFNEDCKLEDGNQYVHIE